MFSPKTQPPQAHPGLITGGGAGGNSLVPRFGPHPLSAAILQHLVPPPPPPKLAPEGQVTHFSPLEAPVSLNPWVNCSAAAASVLLSRSNCSSGLYNYSAAAASLLDWHRRHHHLSAAAAACGGTVDLSSRRQPPSPLSVATTANSSPPAHKFSPQPGELKFVGSPPRFPFNPPFPAAAVPPQLVGSSPFHISQQRSPNPTAATDLSSPHSLWSSSAVSPLNAAAANNINAVLYHGLTASPTSPYNVPSPSGLKWAGAATPLAHTQATNSPNTLTPNTGALLDTHPSASAAGSPNLLVPWLNHLAAKRLLSASSAVVGSYPSSAVAAASFLQRLSQVQQQQQHLCCPHCQKKFGSSSALTKHKLIHSHLRRFACKLCGKRFKRQDHLSGHLMTHAVNKPFACGQSGCNKSYCDQRSLRRHLEKDHHRLKIDPSELKKRKVSHILFKTTSTATPSTNTATSTASHSHCADYPSQSKKAAAADKENNNSSDVTITTTTHPIVEACFTNEPEKCGNGDCVDLKPNCLCEQQQCLGNRKRKNRNSQDYNILLRVNDGHSSTINESEARDSNEHKYDVTDLEPAHKSHLTSCCSSPSKNSLSPTQVTRANQRSRSSSEDCSLSSPDLTPPVDSGGEEERTTEGAAAATEVVSSHSSDSAQQRQSSCFLSQSGEAESTLCIACGQVFFSQHKLTSHSCALSSSSSNLKPPPPSAAAVFDAQQQKANATAEQSPSDKGARKRKRPGCGKIGISDQQPNWSAQVKVAKTDKIQKSEPLLSKSQNYSFKIDNKCYSQQRRYPFGLRLTLRRPFTSFAGRYECVKRRRCVSDPLLLSSRNKRTHVTVCADIAAVESAGNVLNATTPPRPLSCPPGTVVRSSSFCPRYPLSKSYSYLSEEDHNATNCSSLHASLKEKEEMAQSPWNSPSSRNFVRLKTSGGGEAEGAATSRQQLDSCSSVGGTGVGTTPTQQQSPEMLPQPMRRHVSPTNRFSTSCLRPTRVSLGSVHPAGSGRPSSVRPAHRSVEISSLDDLSSPLPECNKYRSASVDETKLHPKQPLDEFLSVVDEYITSDLKQMDHEKSEREQLLMRRRLSDKSSSSNSSGSTHIAAGGDTRTPFTPDENFHTGSSSAAEHKMQNMQPTSFQPNSYCAHPSNSSTVCTQMTVNQPRSCVSSNPQSDYSAHFSFSDRALQYHGHFSESEDDNNSLCCAVRSSGNGCCGSSFMPPIGGGGGAGIGVDSAGGYMKMPPTGTTPLETPKTNDSVFTFDVPAPKSPPTHQLGGGQLPQQQQHTATTPLSAPSHTEATTQSATTPPNKSVAAAASANTTPTLASSSYHIFKGTVNISTTPKGSMRSPISRQSPLGVSSPGMSPLAGGASTEMTGTRESRLNSAASFDDHNNPAPKHRKTEVSLSIDSGDSTEQQLLCSPSAPPTRHHSVTTRSTSDSSCSHDDSPSEGGIFKIPHEPRSSLPNYQSIKRKSKPPSLKIARDYLGTSIGSGGGTAGVYQSWLRSPRHDFVGKGKSGLGRLSSGLKMSSSSAPSIGGSKTEPSSADCTSGGGGPWGGGGSGVDSSSSTCASSSTAVPYTPPPMLCPLRNGSGLFASHFASTTPIATVNIPLKRSSESGSFSVEGDKWGAGAEEEEEVLEPAINIGTEFQANIPALISTGHPSSVTSPPVEKDRAVLLWSPSTCKAFSPNELESYFTLANSCAINGGGCNVELAHHVLNVCRNLKSALRVLLRRKPRFVENKNSCPFIDYPYQNCTKWSHSDRMEFNRAWKMHGKDFHHIHKQMPSKSVKQLVEYYYSWKVMCPSEVHDPTVLDECDLEETADTPHTHTHATKYQQSLGEQSSHSGLQPRTTRAATAAGQRSSGENSTPPQDIIELDGSLSSPPKKRKLSCQYENCFEIFDCQENLTAHIATTHSEGGLASFVNEHPSGHLAGASYLDSRVAAATGVSGLRKAPSNTSFSNINSTDSTAALCQAGPDLDDDNSRSRGGMYEFGNVSAGAGGSNHKSHLSELTISTGMVSSHHGGGLNNASASVVRAAYGADSSGVPSKPTTASTNADCSYFPCKLCGKIFYKVKSRNAHMKSHSLKVLAEREANAALRNNGVTSQIPNIMISSQHTPQPPIIDAAPSSVAAIPRTSPSMLGTGGSSTGAAQRMYTPQVTLLSLNSADSGSTSSCVSSSAADCINVYSSSASNQQSSTNSVIALKHSHQLHQSSEAAAAVALFNIKRGDPNTSSSASSSSFNSLSNAAHALANSPPLGSNSTSVVTRTHTTGGVAGSGGGVSSASLFQISHQSSSASYHHDVTPSGGGARMHILNETVVSPTGEVQSSQALQIDLQANPYERRLWQQQRN